MQNISYIFIYVVCIYVIYICTVSIICNTKEFAILFLLFVRIIATDIYPSCNHCHLCCYGSVCTHLNDFVRTFKWSFIFICRFISQQGLISNYIIIGNYGKVFTDNIFLYLRLLVLTYVFLIYYMFDWENNLSAEHQLACNLVLNEMIRRSYFNGCCC